MGVSIVLSAGNDDLHQDYQQLSEVTKLPQRMVSFMPNLIIVGATNKQSRASVWSRETADMVWAPGEDVKVARLGDGGGPILEDASGTSFAGPLVAGLVAYYKGLVHVPGQPNPYDPATVKKLVKMLSRTVEIDNWPQPQGPHKNSATGNWVSWRKPTVWNGQLANGVSCILTPEAAGCPDLDLTRQLSDIGIDEVDMACSAANTPITKRRRGLGGADEAGLNRRQGGGGTCPVVPIEGSNPGQGNGGDDGGIADQLGPSKTFTYSRGTPSPTCTASCGTYCTDFWCRPDRTGQPLHFTEPTRLPTTTTTQSSGGGGITQPPSVTPSQPGSGGNSGITITGGTSANSDDDLPSLPSPTPWPTNCASTRTWTQCAMPGGGNTVCVVSSSCAATSTPPPANPTPAVLKWVAIHFVELTTPNINQPAYYSRYWSIHEDNSGGSYADFCGSSSVYEKVDTGASLQTPRYPLELGPFKAHGQTCRYRSSSRDSIGRVECENTNPDWWTDCEAVTVSENPWFDFGQIQACGFLRNPQYKYILACSWGEAA